MVPRKALSLRLTPLREKRLLRERTGQTVTSFLWLCVIFTLSFRVHNKELLGFGSERQISNLFILKILLALA